MSVVLICASHERHVQTRASQVKFRVQEENEILPYCVNRKVY